MNLSILTAPGTPLPRLMLVLAALIWSNTALAELPIATRVLSNGLQLIVIPDQHAERLNLGIWYKVGAADEVDGKTGLAHYTEHLMFRSTATTEGGVANSSAALQADNNAYTSADRTVYTDNVTRAELAGVLAIESQRMRALVVPNGGDTELKVVQAERRWRYDTRPSALLRLQADAALFAGHVYARPAIGTPEDIARLTVQDSVDFHARWYAPNNAVIILGGAISPDEAFELLERAFSDLPAKAIPSRDWPTSEIHGSVGKEPLRVADPHRPGRSFAREFIGPSYGTGGPRSVFATKILLQALIDDANGELPRALEDRRRLVEQTVGHYEPAHLGPGDFSLTAYMRPGADLVSAEEALDFVLQQTISQGVPADLVEILKKRWIDRERYAEDDATATATEIGEFITSGGTLEQYHHRLEEIAAVTPADVAAVARQILGGPSILLEIRNSDVKG